jgi:hypothetical protein
LTEAHEFSHQLVTDAPGNQPRGSSAPFAVQVFRLDLLSGASAVRDHILGADLDRIEDGAK